MTSLTTAVGAGERPSKAEWLAAKHAGGKCSAAETAELLAFIRSDQRHRQRLIALLADSRAGKDAPRDEWAELTPSELRDARAAVDEVKMEIYYAFHTSHPTPAQVRLRIRVWDSNPLRKDLSGLDIATMLFAGETAEEQSSELEGQRRRRLEDNRDEWVVDRDYGFTLSELQSGEEAFEPARLAIIEGACAYATGRLLNTAAAAFEQWFTRSRDFRLFTIPYVATAHMPGAEAVQRPEKWNPYGGLDEPSDWQMERVQKAMARFRFAQSTPTEVRAAKRIWRNHAAKLPLPAVDLATGEIVPGC